MAWGIEYESDAALALSNFHDELVEWSAQANPKYNTNGRLYGAAIKFWSTVEDWRELVGDIPVAIALEKIRSRIVLPNLFLYYYTDDEGLLDFQQQTAAEFAHWMEQFIEEMLEEPEPEPESPFDEWDPWEDEDLGPEPEPTPEPPKHKTREELEKEYKKARRRLAEQIRRRRAAGVDVKYDLPDIPKRITEGSIRKIEKIITKIQDEYRYLRGRGYRGMRK